MTPDRRSRTSATWAPNGNQPLITNQNDFQIFDNVTQDRRPPHAQARRQRDLPLARDPERRHDRRQLRLQQQHDLELRGHGQRAAPSTRTRASTSRASCSATPRPRRRNLFDAGTYTEKRPEWSLYVQDDFRVSSKLTLNLGLRYDIYVPWVEVDDRQSNFDERHGHVRGGLGQRRRSRASTSAATCRRTRRATSLRALGFAYDVFGTGRTLRARRRRSVLELHAGRDVLVEGPEPAVPAVDGAHGRAEHELLERSQDARLGGAAAAPGRRSLAAGRGPDAVDLRARLPRRLHGQLEPEPPAAARPRTTWSSSRTSAPAAGSTC